LYFHRKKGIAGIAIPETAREHHLQLMSCITYLYQWMVRQEAEEHNVKAKGGSFFIA